MTDYISRADAIEAVCGKCSTETRMECALNGYFCCDRRELEALPSAELPKGDLISRADAKQAIRDRFKDLATRVEINTVLNEVPSADAVQGWRIGKPTEQGKYMVTLDSFGHKRIDLFYYGKPMMPNRKVRGKCWYRSDDEWGDVVYDDKDIIAWIPLPKPYECGARMKGGAE